MTDPACIHIRNLTVTHKRQGQSTGRTHNRLIAIPDLRLRKGLVTAILGPSGSGKSTLLRSINRLNDVWPDLHTQGQIEVWLERQLWRVYPGPGFEGGERPPLYPPARLRRKIGMVFQHPHLLPLSIARNITLPLTEGAGKPKYEARQILERALKQVGLWDEVKDRLDSGAERLSGGQMQRLCLARALALEPEILLLDEPVASLDARAAAQVEEVIQALTGALSIILVTHSQEQADRLADRQLRMRNGLLE